MTGGNVTWGIFKVYAVFFYTLLKGNDINYGRGGLKIGRNLPSKFCDPPYRADPEFCDPPHFDG